MTVTPLPVELLDFGRVKKICYELKKSEVRSASIFIRKFNIDRAIRRVENEEGYALIKSFFSTFGELMYAHMIYGNLPIEETLEHLLTHLHGLPEQPNGT